MNMTLDGPRTPDAEGKVRCRYCGAKTKPAGIGRHESRCEGNPRRDGAPDNAVERRARESAREKIAALEETLTAGPRTNDPADVTAWTVLARAQLGEYTTLERVING